MVRIIERPLATLLVLLLTVVFWPLLVSAQLDDSWTVIVNGQSIQAERDGSFRISNIAAADLFGPDGPGTSPDFLSDAPVRLTAFSNSGGVMRYAFSDPFQIQNRLSFRIREITITDSPPPFPDSIRIAGSSTLVPVGGTLQLAVLGKLLDGSEIDVTSRTSWTIYRTSNPSIATVGPDGLVTGRSVGPVLITAVNEGATAVKFFQVTSAISRTMLEGFVQLEDGTAVEGASVVALFGQAGLTDRDGFFSLTVEIPEEAERIVSATISATINNARFGGDTGRLPAVIGGITDAGIVTLRVQRRVPITITFDAGNGNPLSYTESGMTVTSRYPFGGAHLHLEFGAMLLNHLDCCSTPYEFTFGGAPFNVVSLDVVGVGLCCGVAPSTFTSSAGAVEVVSGIGTHTFPSAGWEDITSFSWDITAGDMAIDNLVIEVEPQ